MIRTAIILTFMLAVSGVAEAAATLPSPTASPAAITAVERPARLNRLKTTASAEIDRRLSALEVASSHLAESVNLSSETHSKLSAALDAESAGLTTLKSRLAAETDLAAARTQVQALLDEYAVYGLVVPRANLASAADRLQGSATLAAGSLAKVKTKLDALEAAGRNGGDARRLYEEALAKVSDANTKVNATLSLLAMAPAGDYVAAHKQLVASRDDLRVARDDLQSARAGLENIIAALDAVK